MFLKTTKTKQKMTTLKKITALEVTLHVRMIFKFGVKTYKTDTRTLNDKSVDGHAIREWLTHNEVAKLPC